MYRTARTTPLSRVDLLREAKRLGVTRAARNFCVSRNTVYRWRRRSGDLEDRGCRPHRSPRRTPDTLEASIPAEAQRFDDLARVALQRQVSFEKQVKTFAPQLARQRELTEQLKSGLAKLKAKREELVQKRNELVGRAKMAKARVQVQKAVKGVSVMDPTSELTRFEERVRREEAYAKGMEEVAASSLEEQFAQLEDDEDTVEVEARFAKLKAGSRKQLTSV